MFTAQKFKRHPITVKPYKMLKFRLLLAVLAVSINSIAQVTILNETMLPLSSFNTFTAVSVAGTQSWYHNDVYGAVCNGYQGGQSFENEDWLISQPMNLAQTDNVKLTFSHTRGNAGVLNVGVAQGWYQVFATANYSGDPATTNWIELSGLNQAVPVAWQFISSGELIIPDAAKSANSRIAFRYRSSSSASATWEIKNVKVTGEPQSTNPAAGIFRITNWNVEWLGCETFGPTDESLQFNNVVTAMLALNSDVYCLQEIADDSTIPTLVSMMGADQWDGKVVPLTAEGCNQRQGIIYKKSRVQFIGSAELNNGSDAQGNSYYYNWTNGRFPALYQVNLNAGGNLVPMFLVNIHAKAEDDLAMSYTRRLGGSEGLKAILDGPNYNSKNLMIVGDYNDFLVGTTSTACACTDSPYKNFIDDAQHYTAITEELEDVNWNRPLIEHFVLSDEIAANYVSGSAAQDVSVYQFISSFYGTTSHHLPVTAAFQFPVLGTTEFSPQNTMVLSPNPVRTQLHVVGIEENTVVAIYDLTGRQMQYDRIGTGVIGVEDLPSGIYILKAGESYGRFIKE